MTELKPCPFCGGEAEISLDHTVEENHAYGCPKCNIWFDMFNSENAEAEWNTRADAALRREREPVEPQRCAECDCESGGPDCNWIKWDPQPDALALVAAAYRDAAEQPAGIAEALKPIAEMRAVDQDRCEAVIALYESMAEATRNRTPTDAEAHLTALLRAEYERGKAEADVSSDTLRQVAKALKVAERRFSFDGYTVAHPVRQTIRDALALLTQEGR